MRQSTVKADFDESKGHRDILVNVKASGVRSRSISECAKDLAEILTKVNSAGTIPTETASIQGIRTALARISVNRAHSTVAISGTNNEPAKCVQWAPFTLAGPLTCAQTVRILTFMTLLSLAVAIYLSERKIVLQIFETLGAILALSEISRCASLPFKRLGFTSKLPD